MLISALLMLAMVGVCSGYPCFTLGIRYGVWLDQCPTSDLRLVADVRAQGLVRGAAGRVFVQPQARYLEGEGADATPRDSRFRRGVSVQLALLDLEDQPIEGLKVKRWVREGDGLSAEVWLPPVPDGDYRLRAEVVAGFETREVLVDLPLYAPAVPHLMTDRPLYRPGQEVLLRSVTLKRTDLTPLAGRPGRWRVLSPDGSEMMVERDKADDMGIADSSFPLDGRAQVGTWRAEWHSGQQSDSVSFEVRPFRLPRFTVEVESGAPWFGVGDRLRIKGVARYSSGAPVSKRPVVLQLRSASGRWPMPLAWERPFSTRTDASGRFELVVGEVPGDLIERATLTASVQVTEAAGEVASASSTLVLSKDDLQVAAVTELGDGLVGGFNNRAYLRVSTPDGRPLRLAQIEVSNPWDQTAPKRSAQTDEDGVAALQLDPGDPVTVIDPAPPLRARPMVPKAPRLSQATEALTGASLGMAERRAIDRLHPAISRCGDYAPGGASVSLGLAVQPSGAVRQVYAEEGVLGACMRRAMRGLRMPAGRARSYAMIWSVPDSLRPSLRTHVSSVWGSSSKVEAALAQAVLEARPCMARGSGADGATFAEAHWELREGARRVDIRWRTRSGHGLGATAAACVTRALSHLTLDKPAKKAALGTVRITLSVPQPPGSRSSKPTTRTGYELKITALADGERVGKTRLVLPVGTIPPLRLRATPTLASPGDEVLVDLLRGPNFSGTLPSKLELYEGTVRLGVAKVDKKNQARFRIPDTVDGFVHVAWGGGRAVIFVREPYPLTVELSTDADSYRPGDQAQLTITTRSGGSPTPAAVGLSGVDATLAQLAPLLGPDAWGRVTVRATSNKPAFGAFDPRALTLGQVQGENAAKAAVLRISQLPTDAAGDLRISVSKRVEPEVVEVLTASFYRGLEALFVKVRAWEAAAPTGEQMQPELLAKLWVEVLKEQAASGSPLVDAYGRGLTLRVLPDDLLAQLDPRQVVADGTRLPEDVIPWMPYARGVR